MKLFLKLAAVLFTFVLILLPFAASPKPIEAQAGCQLIVSTTEVVAHGSFNVTVQNLQPNVDYVIKYDSSLFPTNFNTPSNSFTTTVNLDDLFGAGDPRSYSGSFLVVAGTSNPLTPFPEICSPTTGITITVIAPPVPTVSITAASTNIPYNTSTDLTWTSTNADTCTLNGTSVATSGTQPTGNLISTTTFTLTCTNVSGTATASVTVNVAPPPAPTCSPPTQTVTTGVNANFTAAAGTGTFSWSAPGGTPSSGSGSNFATNYSTAGTKTVTVTSGTQNATCSVTVTAPAPTADIKANGSNGPITISYGATATLTWSSTNSTTCSVSPGGWSGTSSPGQPTPSLIIDTTYTLNCNGPGGSASDSVVINVNPPTPCSYNFSPTTVDEGGSITVSIISGDSTHTFFAAIDSLSAPSSGTRTGLGNIPLTAPNVPSDTTYLVGARDDVTKNLCALTVGATNTLTVKAVATWHLDPPNVASNQLSVLFSFTPESNGNIALVVAPRSGDVCNWGVLPRPFDSGAIASGNTQVTWNFPPVGDYCAQLAFGVAVSNTQFFTVNPPPGNTWTLSITNCFEYKVIFGISPNSGKSSVIHINETGAEISIPENVSSVVWDAPATPASYTAEIIYAANQVSNPVNIDVPCKTDAIQWTMYLASVINGNDAIFNVKCPTDNCPGIGGEAIVAMKNLDGLRQPLPAVGGIVRFNALPNGHHQAVVVVFMSEESGVVDFTLPQNNKCGWLAFPGGAGVVQGPIKNCALATPGGIISAILPYIFGIAGFLSIIIIVISGIQFITSSGNPEAAASARNRLIFALIGLAVIILAFAVLQIVDKLFLGGTGVS